MNSYNNKINSMINLIFLLNIEISLRIKQELEEHYENCNICSSTFYDNKIHIYFTLDKKILFDKRLSKEDIPTENILYAGEYILPP